jgi:hypothetical protein
MSSLNTIISQINSLTGYNMATASNSYAISSSVPLTSGSVNSIINQINLLTGYGISATDVTFVSGSNVAGSPTLIYVPTPASGTIPTTGIYPGGVIKAEQILNIINALNGVNQNLIIISGSLYVSGSSTMATNLALPFTPDQNVLLSNNGNVSGSNVLDGGSF